MKIKKALSCRETLGHFLSIATLWPKVLSARVKAARKATRKESVRDRQAAAEPKNSLISMHLDIIVQLH